MTKVPVHKLASFRKAVSFGSYTWRAIWKMEPTRRDYQLERGGIGGEAIGELNIQTGVFTTYTAFDESRDSLVLKEARSMGIAVVEMKLNSSSRNEQ